jgi:hypothetical protein
VLQNRGVGGHITFGSSDASGSASHELTDHEHKQLEHAISQARSKVEEAKAIEEPVTLAASSVAHEAAPPTTELKVKRDQDMTASVPGFDDEENNLSNLDEIYIDVHGKVHHRHEEAEAKKSAPKSAPAASDKPEKP